MIFHLSSNCKATESALMRDEKLCRHNLMTSYQVTYINKIHKTIANTRIKKSHNQKQYNKPLAQSQPYEKNSQNMTHSGKNDYISNASTKIIILLHNNDGPCYILQWVIYKKVSP